MDAGGWGVSSAAHSAVRKMVRSVNKPNRSRDGSLEVRENRPFAQFGLEIHLDRPRDLVEESTNHPYDRTPLCCDRVVPHPQPELITS